MSLWRGSLSRHDLGDFQHVVTQPAAAERAACAPLFFAALTNLSLSAHKEDADAVIWIDVGDKWKNKGS